MPCIYSKLQVFCSAHAANLHGSRVLTLSELIDDALEFVADHKDRRNYLSRGEIIRVALGSRPAAEVTPQELERCGKEDCQESICQEGPRKKPWGRRPLRKPCKDGCYKSCRLKGAHQESCEEIRKKDCEKGCPTAVMTVREYGRQ
jgi:hypothetical protein